MKLMPPNGTTSTASGPGVRLSAREKQKLIEQYGCESEGDDEYLFWHIVLIPRPTVHWE